MTAALTAARQPLTAATQVYMTAAGQFVAAAYAEKDADRPGRLVPGAFGADEAETLKIAASYQAWAAANPGTDPVTMRAW